MVFAAFDFLKNIPKDFVSFSNCTEFPVKAAILLSKFSMYFFITSGESWSGSTETKTGLTFIEWLLRLSIMSVTSNNAVGQISGQLVKPKKKIFHCPVRLLKSTFSASLSISPVSYTHLTLPTTPYV